MDDDRAKKLDLYNKVADLITEIMVLAGLPADEGMLGSYFIVAEHVFVEEDGDSYSNYALLPRGGYLPPHVLLGLLGQAEEMVKDSSRVPHPMYVEIDEDDDGEDEISA